MDELAAIAAMTIAGTTCVTAHIGSVDFQDPIPVGDVAKLSAYVYETGNRSLGVRVTVDSRNPRDTEAMPATSACFTMVAVNENESDNDTVVLPSVVPQTDRGKHLVETAPC